MIDPAKHERAALDVLALPAETARRSGNVRAGVVFPLNIRRRSSYRPPCRTLTAARVPGCVGSAFDPPSLGVLLVVVGRLVHERLGHPLAEMQLGVRLMGMPEQVFDQRFVIRSVDVQATRHVAFDRSHDPLPSGPQLPELGRDGLGVAPIVRSLGNRES